MSFVLNQFGTYKSYQDQNLLIEMYLIAEDFPSVEHANHLRKNIYMAHA